MIDNLQAIAIKEGIEPMLKQVLDTQAIPRELEVRLQQAVGKVKILGGDEFVFRSCAFSNEILTGDEAVELPLHDVKQKVGLWQVQKGVTDDWIKKNNSHQGQAMGKYQVLNADQANPSQGLHLILHETLHTLASATWKGGKGKDFGTDEGFNEFFARLASLKLQDYSGAHVNEEVDVGLPQKVKLADVLGTPGKYGEKQGVQSDVSQEELEERARDQLKKARGAVELPDTLQRGSDIAKKTVDIAKAGNGNLYNQLTGNKKADLNKAFKRRKTVVKLAKNNTDWKKAWDKARETIRDEEKLRPITDEEVKLQASKIAAMLRGGGRGQGVYGHFVMKETERKSEQELKNMAKTYYLEPQV